MRTLRYARSWKAGADVVSEDIEIERDGERVEATLVLPAGRKGPLPGWVALGGVSRMGRRHPQLVRFAEALASSGAAVVVPEVPEWQRIEVTPRPAAPTIRGAIELLEKRPEVRPGQFGLIGFSFGAPQVAIAAARGELADKISGIVLFGGYCSLLRTVRCQLTGTHEWEGVDHALTPDPYGRWVVGCNHLTDVPGYEEAGDVAHALHQLACAASDLRVSAWDPHHDQLIRELRRSLPPKRQRLFDLFAPPSGAALGDPDECRDLAVRLTEACIRAQPLLEPSNYLGDVDIPTQLIHGRGDRLIPFTEGHRLRECLPESARDGLTVTGLFSHSADKAPASVFSHFVEGATFFGALRGVINTV